MANLKCKICKKPIKEDTEGNMRYCQGHYLFTKLTIKDNIDYHKYENDREVR